MKVCFRCGVPKDLSEFHKNKRQPDGASNQCKNCANLKRREYYWKDPEANTASVLEYRKKNIGDVLEYNKKYAKDNPEKVKQWRANIALEKKLVYGARQRAKKRGLPCTIAPNDIVVPELCPILGVKIERSKTGFSCDNSPSLDCIIPSLGYIPGNIAVISHKANTIKNNASAKDLKRVLDWVRKQEFKADLVRAGKISV